MNWVPGNVVCFELINVDFWQNNINPASVFTFRRLQGIEHAYMIGGGWFLPIHVIPVSEWQWCMRKWDWAEEKRERRRRSERKSKDKEQAILVSSLTVLMWKSESWIIHSLWDVNNDVQLIKGCMLMSWREEGFPLLSDLSPASPTERKGTNENAFHWVQSVQPALWAGFGLLADPASCTSMCSTTHLFALWSSLNAIKLCKWSEKENPCLKMMNNTSLRHHADLCLHAGVSYAGRGASGVYPPLPHTLCVSVCVCVCVCM